MGDRHPKTLKVVYIVPSRYDEEGYVHRYWRGVLPSNSLCCLTSLTRALNDPGDSGRAFPVSVEAYDESVQRVPIRRILRQARRNRVRLVVGLVGVQTNQFPRAADLALRFREAGVPVLIGGFHVSGVLAMFDRPTEELERLLEAGVSLVQGEVDDPTALGRILDDAFHDRLQPLYAFTQPPDIRRSAVPEADRTYLRRFVFKAMGTLDTSRGCPFNCSFCTVINVQGRRMRCRAAETILEAIRDNYARGISFYFFTDDNLARSSAWEDLFNGLIALRAEGKDIRFMMQIDTQAWRIPRFLEKAAAAGCYRVFVGMESLNPSNLAAAGKRHNKVHQYADMVEAWHRAGVKVHVGYIVGFPHDTRESLRGDLTRLTHAVKVDEASFFMLTPLPGSADHLELVRQGVPLDADLNNYDSTHETFRHARLPPGEWRAAYDEAWETFYSKENMVDILLRTPAEAYWDVFWPLLWNRYAVLLRSHPMITGWLALKNRRERRPGFPRESLARYGWRRLKDTVRLAAVVRQLFVEFQEIWMLTRRKDDPRWATLAVLRERWAEARIQIAESDLGERCEGAAQRISTALASASAQFRELAVAGKTLRGRARQRLLQKAQEIEHYLETFQFQVPGRSALRQAERYMAESVLRTYEEVAIRYVRSRRRFNAYHRRLLGHLRTGRILTIDVSRIPLSIGFEMVLGVRFALAFLRRLVA